jgi:RNA polymerase sigma-70 factor, ECF subfamily
MDPKAQVTLLLRDAKNGHGEALDLLIPIVYDELRRLAAHYLRDERAADTLQPTSLVHEAYMRLVAQDMPEWECRAHFYGVAAHLMRQILVDHARRHRSQKRGAGVAPVPLDEVFAFAPGKSDDVLALDDALTGLAAVDERKCRIIELRYFAGFSVDETAPSAPRRRPGWAGSSWRRTHGSRLSGGRSAAKWPATSRSPSSRSTWRQSNRRSALLTRLLQDDFLLAVIGHTTSTLSLRIPRRSSRSPALPGQTKARTGCAEPDSGSRALRIPSPLACQNSAYRMDDSWPRRTRRQRSQLNRTNPDD